MSLSDKILKMKFKYTFQRPVVPQKVAQPAGPTRTTNTRGVPAK